MNDFYLKSRARAHLIGDPHLGRKFEVGVPSHRRGERETNQMVHFAAELDAEADMIIMVGDLFDNPYVSQLVIVSAARAVLGAAERNENTTYVMMAGNHDQPRNIGTVGAWTSFRKMVEDRLPNLIVLSKPAAIGAVACFPWEWDRRADDQVADLVGARVEHAVGHWDLSVFDGKDDHLAPVAALREAFGEDVGLWSGHYHVPGVYDGVTCTGSMQPYTHGEDPEGRLYVTLSKEEALSRDDLRDKYVRVRLAVGQDMPEIDCLGLTHIREGSSEEEVEVTISADDFDFHRLVYERIKDRDPTVRSFIQDRMSLNVPSEEQL